MLIIEKITTQNEKLGDWIATAFTPTPPLVWTILRYKHNVYGILIEHSEDPLKVFLKNYDYLRHFNHTSYTPARRISDLARMAKVMTPASSQACRVHCSLNQLKNALAQFITTNNTMWIV